jgi:hypothetical protein
VSRRRATLGLGEVMRSLIRDADPKGRRHGARAVLAWDEVVGPTIAEHTRGFALRDAGELVVLVDSPVWATQLSMLSQELISRLNGRLGEDAVRSIRFTVAKDASIAREHDVATPDSEQGAKGCDPEPIPLTETEREQAAHIARAVRDPELREIALRVMIKDLERKKGRRESAGQQGSD